MRHSPIDLAIPRARRRDQVRFMRGLLDTPQTVLEELSASYGPLCAMGAGPLKVVVVGSPALIRDLLMQPNDRFRWDTPLSPFPFVIGKHTMIASDGRDHRRRRGAVQQAFGRRRLNRWIPMIVERADAAIDDLLATTPCGSPTDLYPFGRRLLIEIVVRALFGERLVEHTAEIDARFERAQQYLSSPLVRQIPHPFPFTLRAGVRQDRNALDALIDQAIAASRAGETATDDDNGDVLDALVHRSDLSDAEIRDQVKSLIGAGYDTTASSLAWIIWETALRPDVWTRLRDEADAVFGPFASVRLSGRFIARRVGVLQQRDARELASAPSFGRRRPRGSDRCHRRRARGRLRPDGTHTHHQSPRPASRPRADCIASSGCLRTDRQPTRGRRADEGDRTFVLSAIVASDEPSSK